MHGCLLVHGQTGALVYAREFTPNFGLHAAPGDAGAFDAMQLAAFVFALHMNAGIGDGGSEEEEEEEGGEGGEEDEDAESSVSHRLAASASARGGGGSRFHELVSYTVGTVGIHFGYDAASRLIGVVFVDAAMDAAVARFLVDAFQAAFLAKYAKYVPQLGMVQRKFASFQPHLLDIVRGVPFRVADVLASSLDAAVAPPWLFVCLAHELLGASDEDVFARAVREQRAAPVVDVASGDGLTSAGPASGTPRGTPRAAPAADASPARLRRPRAAAPPSARRKWWQRKRPLPHLYDLIGQLHYLLFLPHSATRGDVVLSGLDQLARLCELVRQCGRLLSSNALTGGDSFRSIEVLVHSKQTATAATAHVDERRGRAASKPSAAGADAARGGGRPPQTPAAAGTSFPPLAPRKHTRPPRRVSDPADHPFAFSRRVLESARVSIVRLPGDVLVAFPSPTNLASDGGRMMRSMQDALLPLHAHLEQLRQCLVFMRTHGLHSDHIQWA